MWTGRAMFILDRMTDGYVELKEGAKNNIAPSFIFVKRELTSHAQQSRKKKRKA